MADDKGRRASGIDVQLQKFADIQSTLKQMQDEFNELRSGCSELRREKDELEADRDRAALDRDAIVKEINDLKIKRDGMQEEVSHDQNTSSSEFDVQGRLKRQIWLLEQKVSETTRARETAIEVEQAVSNSLRGQVEHLETVCKQIKMDLEDTERREEEMLKELEHQSSQYRATTSERSIEMEGLRSKLKFRGEELAQAKERTGELEEERAMLRREVQRLEIKRDIEETPRKALQSRPVNISNPARPPTPTTPSKGAKGSPNGKSEHASPSESLVKRHTYLEERHATLNSEYHKLRTQYSQDLRHWKDYKAAEDARAETKRQRKVAKKANEAALPLDISNLAEEVAPVEDLPQSSQTASQPLSQDDTKLVSASEDSQSLPVVSFNRRSSASPMKGERTEELEDTDTEEEFHSSDREDEEDAEKAAMPPSYQLAEHHLAQAGGDSKGVETANPPGSGRTLRRFESPTKRKLEEMMRVTPWLGSGPAPGTIPVAKGHKTSGLKQATTAIHDEGGFNDNSQEAAGPRHDTPVASTSRTPLIRDRGVAVGPSLHRMALQHPQQLETGETTPTTSRTPRAVNLEGLADLTSKERSRQLKRLNSMSAAEKREYYGKYKGNGRYVGPDELAPQVTDDYEIDPEQNEGANFQFQDVKRRKTDRRQMHGGDCECCKEYYQAVGALPKFNQGPKWKDSSSIAEGSTTRDAEVEDHQNRVSRHRETWKRAATPPGFWDIGFPSTQKATEQNAIADEMIRQRDAQIRREAAQKDSKWRKKT